MNVTNVNRNVYKRDILEPLLVKASKEKVLRSPDPHDDDDDDCDVREIVYRDDDDDDIRDVDDDAYAEVKEMMTTAEFMEKQVNNKLGF